MGNTAKAYASASETQLLQREVEALSYRQIGGSLVVAMTWCAKSRCDIVIAWVEDKRAWVWREIRTNPWRTAIGSAICCLVTIAIIVVAVVVFGGGGGGCETPVGVALFCDDILTCYERASDFGARALIGEWQSKQYAAALASGLAVGVSPAIGSSEAGFDGKGDSPGLFYDRLRDNTVMTIVQTDVSPNNKAVLLYAIELQELGSAAEQMTHPERLFYAQDVEYQVVAKTAAEHNQMYAQWAALMAVGRAYISPQIMGIWPVVSSTAVKSLQWDSQGVLDAFNQLKIRDVTPGGTGELIRAQDLQYADWTDFCYQNGYIDGFIAQGYGASGCLTNEAATNQKQYQAGIPFVTMVECDKEAKSPDFTFVVRDEGNSNSQSCTVPFDRAVYMSSMQSCTVAEVQTIGHASTITYTDSYKGQCTR